MLVKNQLFSRSRHSPDTRLHSSYYFKVSVSVRRIRPGAGTEPADALETTTRIHNDDDDDDDVEKGGIKPTHTVSPLLFSLPFLAPSPPSRQVLN